MAIETRIINGSFTELYTGGGNYMTQAKATHFHSFWTRKILAPTESVSDFREVTAAERAKLEAADAAWERPPQSFIDACMSASADVCYNEETGYFELNGLTDITYEQMMSIYELGKDMCEIYPPIARKNAVRTNMMISASNAQYPPIAERSFSGHYKMEVIKVSEPNTNTYTARLANGSCAFVGQWCKELREVIGSFTRMNVGTKLNKPFPQSQKLHTLKIIAIDTDADLSTLQSLSAESIDYMIDGATDSGKARIFTYHPDAYARITDEMFEKAAAKNITITSA